jgi:hypothetical protein
MPEHASVSGSQAQDHWSGVVFALGMGLAYSGIEGILLAAPRVRVRLLPGIW